MPQDIKSSTMKSESNQNLPVCILFRSVAGLENAIRSNFLQISGHTLFLLPVTPYPLSSRQAGDWLTACSEICKKPLLLPASGSSLEPGSAWLIPNDAEWILYRDKVFRGQVLPVSGLSARLFTDSLLASYGKNCQIITLENTASLLSQPNPPQPSWHGSKTNPDPSAIPGISDHQLLDAFFNSQNIGIYLIDAATGLILKVNSGFCDMYGYKPEDVLGQHYSFHVSDTDKERAATGFENTLIDTVNHGEYTVLHKNGTLLKVFKTRIFLQIKEKACVLNIVRDISDSMRFQKLLGDQANTGLIGGWEVDIATGDTVWTDQIYRIYEIPYDTPLSLAQGLASYPPEDQALQNNALDKAINQGISFDLELRFTTATGRSIWVRATCTPEIQEGKVRRLIGTFQDITARKLARVQADNLSFVASQTTAGILITDKNKKVIWCNEAIAQITGYSSEEMIGHIPGSLLQGPGTDPETITMVRQALTDQKHITAELLNYNKNGDPYWIELSIDPIFNAQGELEQFIAVQHDITNKRLMLDALKNTNMQLEFAIQAANLGLWDWDLRSDTVYYSDRWKSMLGYAPDEVPNILSSWADLAHPEDRAATLAQVEDHLQGKRNSIEAEIRMRAKNGEWKYILSCGKIAEWDINGKPSRIIGLHLDITERIKAEQEIRETKNLLESVVQLSPTFTTLVDAQTNDVLYASHSMWQVLGYTMDERQDYIKQARAEQKNPLHHPDDATRVDAYWNECKEMNNDDSINSIEYRVMNKQGEWEWISLITKVFKWNKENKPAVFINSFAIITDRKHNEQQIIELNEKLEEKVLQRTAQLKKANQEKDEILQLVAHDLRNPLTGIFLLAETVQSSLRRKTDPDFISEKMHKIQGVVSILNKITGNLLSMAALEEGRIKFNCELMNMRDIVYKSIQHFADQSENKNIHIQVSVPEILPFALGDPVWIDEVVENLLSNALKYSPRNTKVAVSLAWEQRESPILRLCIRDQGPGILENEIHLLFTKFARLSARPSGGEKSTGLGLSIVRKLVEGMNGRVWCESTPGQGAEFIVELPASW